MSQCLYKDEATIFKLSLISQYIFRCHQDTNNNPQKQYQDTNPDRPKAKASEGSTRASNPGPTVIRRPFIIGPITDLTGFNCDFCWWYRVSNYKTY